jgi:DtxR family transcriptional regulator, Mn-dependent transcriptional regulator
VNRPDDLIDTGEMYLRCVLELEEEGTVPLRARLAERLGHSMPTVSQTMARMERDGLLRVSADRHIELTGPGRLAAVRVMRKHRIAECMLADVLGVDWRQVHQEACRWEHVISDTVERRMLDLLGHPTHSPYGNPIPGLAELGDNSAVASELPGLTSLDLLPPGTRAVTVRRIGEPVQSDPALLDRLGSSGFRPGAIMPVGHAGDHITVGADPDHIVLDESAARGILVTVP